MSTFSRSRDGLSIYEDCGLRALMERKQAGCGRLRELKAALELLADGTEGGVVRTVTIYDCGLDSRAGVTRKCMGGGSISYCCFLISHSILSNQNAIPIKEF